MLSGTCDDSIYNSAKKVSISSGECNDTIFGIATESCITYLKIFDDTFYSVVSGDDVILRVGDGIITPQNTFGEGNDDRITNFQIIGSSYEIKKIFITAKQFIFKLPIKLTTLLKNLNLLQMMILNIFLPHLISHSLKSLKFSSLSAGSNAFQSNFYHTKKCRIADVDFSVFKNDFLQKKWSEL